MQKRLFSSSSSPRRAEAKFYFSVVVVATAENNLISKHLRGMQLEKQSRPFDKRIDGRSDDVFVFAAVEILAGLNDRNLWPSEWERETRAENLSSTSLSVISTPKAVPENRHKNANQPRQELHALKRVRFADNW
jgi:hypothetical protein